MASEKVIARSELFSHFRSFNFMGRSSQKKESDKHKKSVKPNQKKPLEKHEEEGFDFGGIPKDLDFKKNMGCGG